MEDLLEIVATFPLGLEELPPAEEERLELLAEELREAINRKVRRPD